MNVPIKINVRRDTIKQNKKTKTEKKLCHLRLSQCNKHSQFYTFKHTQA